VIKIPQFYNAKDRLISLKPETRNTIMSNSIKQCSMHDLGRVI